jgi:hypothetical protein
MIRFLMSLISMRSESRSRRERNGAAQDSQLLEGLPHMSPRSQEFVRSSLAAWDSLPESERNLPSRF